MFHISRGPSPIH